MGLFKRIQTLFSEITHIFSTQGKETLQAWSSTDMMTSLLSWERPQWKAVLIAGQMARRPKKTRRTILLHLSKLISTFNSTKDLLDFLKNTKEKPQPIK